MDPLSIIVTALAAGAAEAAKPAAAQAVKDAYAGLKALILRKFGQLGTPLQGVEEKPTSEARQAALKAELGEAGAERDAELRAVLDALVQALRQHAPQSIPASTTTFSGAVSGAVAVGGGDAIQSGGAAVVTGSVNTGGGAFVGRDQVINNITVHSIDQVDGLTAVLKHAIAELGVNPEPDALDAMGVVLDEISKLYLLIDGELTRFLSLSFDDAGQAAHDREVLLSLEGGKIHARAMEARGHCHKIAYLYTSRLRAWLGARLAPEAMGRIDRAFGALGMSDADMAYAIHLLADWLGTKAQETLDALDGGDPVAARGIVKAARRDCLDMRRKVARTVSEMRDIQAELLLLAS